MSHCTKNNNILKYSIKTKINLSQWVSNTSKYKYYPFLSKIYPEKMKNHKLISKNNIGFYPIFNLNYPAENNKVISTINTRPITKVSFTKQ